MAVKVIACVVCSKNEDVKYKCPCCRATYCSVGCCKEHKLTCSPDNSAGDSAEAAGSNESSINGIHVRPKYHYETDDTVSIEQLERLRGSKKLKDLLANPHLRSMMAAIDSAPDAADLIGQAMKEPIFTEMADECLSLISNKQEAEAYDGFM